MLGYVPEGAAPIYYMGQNIWRNRLNEDGTPHLTYYDKALSLSFVWDGKADYIEVCSGGYGEPVYAFIPKPQTLVTLARPDLILEYFSNACEIWVNMVLSYIDNDDEVDSEIFREALARWWTHE